MARIDQPPSTLYRIVAAVPSGDRRIADGPPVVSYFEDEEQVLRFLAEPGRVIQAVHVLDPGQRGYLPWKPMNYIPPGALGRLEHANQVVKQPRDEVR
jgi:hypothetical protein